MSVKVGFSLIIIHHILHGHSSMSIRLAHLQGHDFPIGFHLSADYGIFVKEQGLCCWHLQPAKQGPNAYVYICIYIYIFIYAHTHTYTARAGLNMYA